MTRNYQLLLVAIVAVFIAGGALPGGVHLEAAPHRQTPLRERVPPDRPGLSPGEVVNMLDAYAIVQAHEALQLSDQVYGEFVSRLKQLQQVRRRGVQGRNGILQELRRLTSAQGAPVDDAAIRERLQALADHEDRAARQVRQAYRALDEVLDPRQQARFRLLEEQLERRKIDLLQRARQGAAARERRQ